MVSGGTYGTEDIVHGAGYGKAILILLLTPILWSLPTAFMIGELSSALPYEGGYYAWVRRAMGNFWGFQEAWLSLVASIFDMAIYPTLFVLYLTRLFPWFAEGYRGWMVGLAVVVVCALLNIAGVRVVSTTSLWLLIALVGAVHPDRGHRAVQDWSTGSRRHQADDFIRGHPHGPAHLHVELHGLGQRLDHRHRSRAPAADLSARHAGRGCDRGPELHRSRGRHVDDRAFLERMGNRILGGHRRLAGWPAVAHRPCARRHDQRIRHVQRFGDELFASAAGHGAGRHVAAHLWQTACSLAGAVGCDCGLRRRAGRCALAWVSSAW